MASRAEMVSSNPHSLLQGRKGHNIDRTVDRASDEIGAADPTTAPLALFTNASKFVVHNLHVDASQHHQHESTPMLKGDTGMFELRTMAVSDRGS
jgi:hypothetical protein